MDRANTKQEILNASLDLFSIQGFEATSVSQIANAVGIRKASLYSHFESKQAILDALIDEVFRQYDKRSIFPEIDEALKFDNQNEATDKIVKIIQEQIKLILHDSYISKARKMLVIEQFRNKELADLQTKQNYTNVMKHFAKLISHLISKGMLADCDCEIMSAQLFLPISMWINLCDREPEREQEVMELTNRHVKQFFKIYQATTQ